MNLKCAKTNYNDEGVVVLTRGNIYQLMGWNVRLGCPITEYITKNDLGELYIMENEFVSQNFII